MTTAGEDNVSGASVDKTFGTVILTWPMPPDAPATTTPMSVYGPLHRHGLLLTSFDHDSGGVVFGS